MNRGDTIVATAANGTNKSGLDSVAWKLLMTFFFSFVSDSQEGWLVPKPKLEVQRIKMRVRVRTFETMM